MAGRWSLRQRWGRKTSERDVRAKEQPVSNEALSNLLHEERQLPAERGVRGGGRRQGRPLRRGRHGPARLLGRAGRAAAVGEAAGTRCSTGEPPFAKWFVGGTLNVAVQLRRPARRGRPRRPGRAPLRGRARRHPHAHLRRPAARGLPGRERADRRSASSAGDRVAIYLPMIPEAAVAMLACARIGAPHSVVFGGFSAEALRVAHRRRRGEARHHRRRRLPPRRGRAR